MTLIGKRRRTPNFDPPSDAELAMENLADVWPTITRVGPRPGTAIYTIEWRVNACWRGNVKTRAGGHVGARVESTARLHGKGGACGWHRQNEIHADVDSVVSKNLADSRVLLPGDNAGSTTSRRAGPQRRRGATVPSMIQRICEL